MRTFSMRDGASAIIGKIQQRIQQLPVLLQAEVLDFVEYLLAKVQTR